jgi:hypothetical protein
MAMIEVLAFGLALLALADRVWRRRKAHRPRAVYLGLPPVPYRCSTCGFDHDRGDPPCDPDMPRRVRSAIPYAGLHEHGRPAPTSMPGPPDRRS